MEEAEGRFLNYFAVVGLKTFELADEGQRTGPFSTDFKAEVIDLFPPRSDANPFNEGITMFCQPSGWKVSRESFQPTQFGFVLTDMLGKKMYGACLNFPEKHPYSAIKKLFQEQEKEKSAPPNAPDTPNSQTANPYTFVVAKGEDFPLQDHEVIYVPKSLVILSDHPFYTAFRSCLLALYNIYLNGSPISFNRWVSFLATEVPLPRMDKIGIKFTLGTAEVAISRPSRNILPLADFPLERFFRTLGSDLIIRLVASLLFEQKVLFVSRHYTQLLLAAESLSALIYPFSVQHTYIPILPSQALEGIEVPNPFIMGVHQSMFEDITSDLSEVIVVDLDDAKLLTNASLSELSKEEGLVLQESIAAILQPDLVTPDNAFSRGPSDDPLEKRKTEEALRSCFFHYFVSVFQDYRSYVTLVKLFPEPIVLFQKNSFLQRHAMRREFLEPFLATTMFDSFIRVDGASVERSLFSILTEKEGSPEERPVLSSTDTTSYLTIKNPLEVGENSTATSPFNGKLLEFNTFGPITFPPNAFKFSFPPQSTSATEAVKSKFPEDGHLVTDKQLSDDAKLAKELAQALHQGKKTSPTYSSDPEKIFQVPRNRQVFSRELCTRVVDKQPFEQKLEEPQFDLLCTIVKKIFIESKRLFDAKTAMFLIPVIAYFYRAPKNTLATHYYLYDFIREIIDELDFLGDSSFWEEALLHAVEGERRSLFKGEILDAVESYRALPKEEQVRLEEKEEELIFGKLKEFVIMMARLGFPQSETQKFIETMAMRSSLNDQLMDKLYECAEEWTSREVERIQTKKEADEDGVPRKKSMHGHFINSTNFPDIILLDGEQITAELDKVLYVSPVNNVAEGKLYISNFKLCFVGLYLQGPFDQSVENLVEQDDSLKKKRKVTIEINFGSIFEITKTPFMSVKGPSSSMWVPEGVLIHAADFQIATFCIDDEGVLGPRELTNLISRSSFPITQDNMFAYSFTCQELKGGFQHSEAYNAPISVRRNFQDDFNEKLDRAVLGLSQETEIFGDWRVCHGNEKYGLCPSYPKAFVVHKSLSDDDINTLAKFHRRKRLPVVCWRHPVQKCVLLRSALPKAARGNQNSRCIIDEQLCNLLAEANAAGKVAILTEKESATLLNDLLYKNSEKNLGYYYANVNFVHVSPSAQEFSIPIMQSRFMSFMRTCADADELETFWSAAEEDWLYVISDLLHMATVTAGLMERGSSVIVSLEDGWDRTTQVVSLAQLLMDPWYRTISGFQCLLEKEWLKLGHKFGQRMGQSKADSRSEMAPIFLQFMDCVFQLTCQFPTEFEFNEVFLKDLLTEVCAGRFGNFLFNSESERNNNFVFAKTYLAGSWFNGSELADVERTIYPQWTTSALKIWEGFYFSHFSNGKTSTQNEFNEHCKELLMQYVQLTVLRMGLKDEDSPRKEGESLWLETWKQLTQTREKRLATKASMMPRLRVQTSALSDTGEPEDANLEGYLKKEGGRVKSWKQRWFVLNFREKTCSYYVDNTKSACKGTIELSAVSEVRAFDSTPSRSPFSSGNKNGFRFDIVTPKRTYVIEAANPPSRSTWIEALRRSISTSTTLAPRASMANDSDSD